MKKVARASQAGQKKELDANLKTSYSALFYLQITFYLRWCLETRIKYCISSLDTFDLSSFFHVSLRMKTELHIAVLEEQIETVSDLLKRKVNVNAEDDDGNTPLFIAVESGNFPITKMLLVAGAKVNMTNKHNNTPLHVAVEMHDENITKLLLGYGATVNVLNDFNKTPMFLAVQSRKINIIKLLIDFGINVNEHDLCNYTALHMAAMYGNSTVVKLLVDAGADLNSKTNVGTTPLHEAIDSENVYSVKVLIDAGADIEAKNRYDETPVHYASQKGNVNILKILLKAGVYVNAKDDAGFTSLIWTIYEGHTNYLNMLINTGTNVNEYFVSRGTALTCLMHKISKMSEGKNRDGLIKSLRTIMECTDVNLIDHFGVNIIAYNMESSVYLKGKKIFYKVIFEHLAVLKVLSLPIDSSLLNYISKLKSVLTKYFASCIREAERAKNTKIYKCWITFFNLLIDDRYKLVKYAGNEDLVKDVKRSVKKFPIFSDLMQTKMTAAIKDRKLFENAANVLSYQLPFLNPTSLITRDILDVLTVEDWKTLSE